MRGRGARSRWALAAASAVTVALGLGSRRPEMPVFVLAYVGDVLYAVLVWWLVAWVAPRASALRLSLAAYGWCAVVEVSQALHPAWLDEARSHTLVALVLGRGFLASDLVCYAVGVGVAAGVDRLARASTVSG